MKMKYRFRKTAYVSPRGGDAKPLKAAIEQYLKAFRIEAKFRQTEIAGQWEKLMGKSVALHTKSVYIRSGKLYVQVDSAPLKQELHMAREQIKARVNGLGGGDFVEEVVVF